PHDGATPSGNAVAATAMARLFKLTGRREYFDRVERTLNLFQSVMVESAVASAQMVIALELFRGPTVEIVFAGDPDDPETLAFKAAVHRRFLPNKVVASVSADGFGGNTGSIALLEGKSSIGGRPAVYLCRDFVCQAPIVDRSALETALDGLTRGG
ncbi:MAG: aldo/keto reductase, partial [Planctomycetia bacterium]